MLNLGWIWLTKKNTSLKPLIKIKYSHTETILAIFLFWCLKYLTPNDCWDMDICQLNTTLTWGEKGRREGEDDPPSLDSPTYWRYYHLFPYLSGLYLSEEKLDFSSNKWRASVSCLLSVADMVWLMSIVQQITDFWRICNIISFLGA